MTVQLQPTILIGHHATMDDMIVGTEWHQFIGRGHRCEGRLGWSNGAICNQVVDAWIHDPANPKALSGDLCVVPTSETTPSHNESTSNDDSAAEERGAAEPVIVGIKWHEFKGSGALCIGVLGDIRGDLCAEPRDALIHSEERKPQWIKEAEQRASGLKDSGKRLQFESGMVRDVAEDKPGFQYLIPKDVPMSAQMLTRVAEHLRKGAVKYEPRNWEKGDSDAEAERARESALRHMMQWLMGETDEDHAAAVIINVLFAETMQWKSDQKKEQNAESSSRN
jgi:dATP/dGTP diphosphohydrolase